MEISKYFQLLRLFFDGLGFAVDLKLQADVVRRVCTVPSDTPSRAAIPPRFFSCQKVCKREFFSAAKNWTPK
ncbi:MAG TPA: hypothetical protein PKW29_02235 [Clostridia bacterium]|nr:hypothetical protein [Clostridia bacterium]